ncbi:hypothetical protein [Bacillus thuringiensis]|uniref:hypothetical protein n=1 Tax=Bacillus thuringiensis TaxID=1428 RepID=UPI000D02A344|nr:hypothetical protein [Bacillus thuringiensis]PRT32157.1 hypothetical protein C6351_01355 [Bacillus thuringiensis]
MNIQNFQLVFTEKIKMRNGQKRLLAVEDYLSENYGINVPFDPTGRQYLLQIMQLVTDNPLQADNIFSELITILTDRYCNGEPYLLSTLSTSLTLQELQEHLQDTFRNEDDNSISFDSFDFHLEDCTIDPNENIVILKVRYLDWFINNITNQRERELNSGTITLSFDLNNNLCLGSSGYNKLFNKLTELLKDNIIELNINNIYIQRKQKFMRNSTLSDFSPLTLLVIHLIFKKFEEIGFTVQSVDSLSFNNENAPRVKNAKLGGNDLFQDRQVVERIYNGDKITKFTVSLLKINRNEALQEERAVIISLTIDFKSILKFTFEDNEFSDTVIKKLCIDLYSGIDNLINDETTIEEGANLLKENIVSSATYGQTSYQQLVSTLKEGLLNEANDNHEFIQLINTHFKKVYNV